MASMGLPKWGRDLDRAFRSLAGPRFRGVSHSAEKCRAKGNLGLCRFCGRQIYFWSCDHLRHARGRWWLPFEGWQNGRLERGEWAFHNDGYCTVNYDEMREALGA